jgi:hypothetical protein
MPFSFFYFLQEGPDNPVSEEMQKPFNIFLARDAEVIGGGAPDIVHLKQIGNRNKAVIFKDFPGHLSVANVHTATEPTGKTRFTLFKHLSLIHI